MSRRLALPLALTALLVTAGAAHAEPAFTSATLVGGAGTDAPYRVAALDGGAAIIAGRFTGRAAFGRHVLETQPGRDAAFVARLRANGSFAWATRLAGTGHDIGLAALPDGSTLVVGDFRHRVRIGGQELRSQGSYDAFVTRLDPAGGVVWAVRAGGWLTDAARGVAVLPDGSALITGRFRGTAEFGRHRVTSEGGTDVFVAKVAPDGRFAWARRAGGPGGDSANGIAVRADGTAIVVGRFSGRAEFGDQRLVADGGADAFVAAIDERRRFAWATAIGGPGDDTALGLEPHPNGGAIVLGGFGESAAAGPITLTGTGIGNGFAARIGRNGGVVWATPIAGVGTSPLRAASVFADGSALVVGHVGGRATLGGLEVASAGLHDIVVARLAADGTPLWARTAGGPGDDLGMAVALRPDGTAIMVGRVGPDATFGGIAPTGPGGDDIAIATLDDRIPAGGG